MAISPTGSVGGLVSDAAQPRPATAPLPDQPAATQAETPSQAVTPASTDTAVNQEAPSSSPAVARRTPKRRQNV